MLPEDTALLEYVTLVPGKSDAMVVFIVTQHDGVPALTAHFIAADPAGAPNDVNALRTACSDPRKPYRGAAQTLYRKLIAPSEQQLAGKTRLLICPDDQLWDVPFAALLGPDAQAAGPADRGSKFLADRFEIAYAYSAAGAVAQMARAVEGRTRVIKGSALVFANPDFADGLRFGDDPQLPGVRPLIAASRKSAAPIRPIPAASRKSHAPTRPIPAASRKYNTPTRPIPAASRKPQESTRPIPAASRQSHDSTRPIPAASRKLNGPTRPIPAASRPISAPSRDLFLPRGGYLAQLPGTQKEAEAIKADIPDAAVFTGAAAQESVAKLQAGNYRYLHFATHGFFNDAAPLLSAIVLALPGKKSSQDGFLTAREIFDLDLNADLVVLSACNTARGEKRSGEGIVGLTWALFAAGAPTQVVSQWAVNDESTALLMKRFYANLIQKHMHKGEALRHAALSLKDGTGKSSGAGPAGNAQKRDYRHPYYWAPFILMGDWR